jgi:hypothetical protein
LAYGGHAAITSAGLLLVTALSGTFGSFMSLSMGLPPLKFILKIATQSWCLDTVSTKWEVPSYSFNRTRRGKAPWRRYAQVHHAPRGQVALPRRAG